MKALVTGGAGFIGSSLVNRLIELGHEVVVIDNLSTGKKERMNKGITFWEYDIRDKDISSFFKGVDWVFHTAALPRVPLSIRRPLETHDININGTLNVLMAAKAAKVKKFIYSSSSSAYGNQVILPLEEEMKPEPISPYGLQKYVGEHYCRNFSIHYGMSTVSLRYFNVYGPNMAFEGAYKTVVATFLEQKKNGKPLTITGDGKQTRDFTYIDDVVEANILAATSDRVGSDEVINIGKGSKQSINRIAKLIGGEVEYIRKRIEPENTLADNSKAFMMLDWSPKVEIEDGIELTKNWFESL